MQHETLAYPKYKILPIVGGTSETSTPLLTLDLSVCMLLHHSMNTISDFIFEMRHVCDL